MALKFICESKQVSKYFWKYNQKYSHPSPALLLLPLLRPLYSSSFRRPSWVPAAVHHSLPAPGESHLPRPEQALKTLVIIRR